MSAKDPGLPVDDRLSFKIFNLVRLIKVRFKNEHIYSRRVTEEIAIATQTAGLEFGYEFKVREKYLFYAVENRDEKSELVVKGSGERGDSKKLLKILGS